MDERLRDQLERLSPAQRELFRVLLPAKPAVLSPAEPAGLDAPRPAPARYALAPAQERFWLLEQLDPGEPAHHVAGALVLHGALDVPALQRALAHLVERHAVLRTTFELHEQAPVAVIQPATALALPREDLTQYDELHRRARLQELRASNGQAPFDLRQAPLLRCTLVQLAPVEWQLVWCVHHIAADGLSMVVLARELAQLYAHFCGAAPAPPAPHRQYQDFVHAQREREQRGELAAGLAWHRERLQDAPATTLPPDRARGPGAMTGGRLQRALAPELARALLALGQAHGCTPFVTLLAGFVAALRRQIGDDDLVLGIPVGNRAGADWQDAVGPFVNSTVLRVRARGDATFAALLGNVRAAVAATLAHGDVPFERLVQHLRPERHLDRNPLFQVMFNFVDFAALEAPPPGLQWHYEETPAGTLFHFTLWVRRRGDSVVLEAEYDTHLFTAATIERRLGELHTLLQGAVMAPETTLEALPLLPPDELATLRAFENGPPLPGGADDVLSLVHAADRGGVADAQRAWTRAEVLAGAAAVAARLAAAGVRPGDRVALDMARSGALPAAMLGIWQAGAVLVPLDPALPALRRDAVLAAARPACVLTDGSVPVAHTDAREVVFPHGEGAATAFAKRPVDADAPAYVLFTSGSTGQPKGVVVPHRALAAFLRAARATFGIGPGDVLLAITSPTFDIALLELLLPLCCGATAHVAAAEAVRDGAVLARELAASGATVLQATPSTLRLLLAAGWRGDERLRLLCGGEALTEDLARSLRRHCREVWNVYGPTETTIWSTAGRIGDGEVHIGQPLPGTTCRVLDEHGERVPLGCRGELWIGGAGVATGYLDDAGASAARFVAGSYRTGDQVRWSHDGTLVFCGRADGQVKVRGHRVELAEIEAHTRAHPDVADAVATTAAGADGLDVIVHVVPRASTTPATTGALAWRDVWQQVYAGKAPDPDFDCRGWTDSRDGRAIPSPRMRAWRDHTAARLRELAPRAVLEVGCGTGLITAALAAERERWLAIDQAPAAVAAVQAMAARHRWPHVAAQVLAAHDLDELPANAFDCVILNSVVQYFPGLPYLLAVLAAARRRLRAGGVIFVGDVRLLPLHGAAAAWIEDAVAEPALAREQFAARCERRCAHDPELLLDGGLFEALVRAGAFADHWLALRAGSGDTEMDRFRADAVLAIDSVFAAPEPLRGAPRGNARIAAAAAMFARRHDASLADVASLRAAAATAGSAACEPDTLGHAVTPTTDGVGLLALRAPLHERRRVAAANAPLPEAAALQGFANTPHAAARDTALQDAVREHLRARLPAPVAPSHVVVMAALPRLPSGKLDRRNLPRPRPTAGEAPTATPTERRVASLFGELLGVGAAGANDDFFALGGHSLAAARLLAHLRATFHVELPLRAVFEAPTVKLLAAAVDAAEPTERPPLLPRARREPLRPSGTMLRLWFLQRLSPGSRAYLMWGLVQARGPLDLTVLRRAVEDVVQRHEVLGLRLVERQGEATLGPRAAPVPFHVCADAAAFERTLRELTGDALEPLQVFAVALAPDTHRLAFVLHHAYADGWSVDVLQRDLSRAYAARAAGRTPAPAPLPVSWLDYSAWLDDALAGTRRERLVAFWRDELRDAPPALSLPAAAPRPPGPAECGATLAIALPDAQVAAAKALGALHGATLFHVVLAAFTAWLSRLADQDDVVVGTTIANRDDPAVDEVIGCFVNTLPLRARLHDRPSFAAHVARTRDTVVRAMEHRQLPFQQLVDAVDPPRSLARSPLFQATLDWFEQRDEPLRMGDVELVRLPHDPGTAKFELGLLVHAEQPFRGVLEYRSDLFPAPTIAAWWRAFEHLFAAALATPAMPVDELPWLDDAARAALLAAGRGPVRAWPDGDVVAAFAAAAARTPHAIALRGQAATCSYAELLGGVAALAAELQALGVGRGDRVAVHLERGPDLIVAVLAVLASGAAYVPLDVDLPPARLQAMLAAAHVRLGLRADAAPRELAAVPWRTVRAPAPAAPRALVLPDLRSHDAAYVLFTSGSTGAPKGVIVSHGALRNYVLWARDTYDAAGGAPLPTPLGFDLSITALFPVLLAGGTVYLPPPGDGAEPLLASLAHGPFGLCKLTPSHLRALLAARPPSDVAQVARGLVLGGEPLDHELLAPLRAAMQLPQRHWNEYGPTEATVGCAIHEVPANAPDRGPVPIGRAIANMRLYVLDAHRAPVPQGVIGELWIAGAGLADGYLGRPELTAAAFADDPFAPGERMYRSGDRAAFTTALELVHHGRIDAQVKIRGHRVEPGEARALLLAQPGVRDAAVVVATSPAGGDHLVAYVAGTADEPTLRRALAAWLPAAAMPARFVAVPALPLNRHGKLDRSVLPDPWQTARARSDDPFDAAEDAATARLVQLARDLLRVPDLGAHDDFFRAGGDSILALQLVARGLGIGLQLSVADVFATKHLADLARTARAAGPDERDVPSEPASEPASGPLLPMQAWFFAQHFAAPRHYDQAIWLSLRAAIPVAAIQRALDQLIARHPALRSRCGAGGQEVLAARAATLVEAPAPVPAPLDPEAGEVFAATFVAGGPHGTGSLHLRAHHLAVDAVSWRTLAEELEALLLGRTLPPPTTSPIRFARWLDAACRTGPLAGDAQFFRALPEVPALHLPAVREGDAVTGTARLPAPARHVRVDEVLVAAAARAVAVAAGVASMRVDIEGHGRTLPGAPAVHRTVGWFTTMHPVVLDQLDAPPPERLVHALARLRATPNRGAGALPLGLPPAPVLCNHLGVLDAGSGELLALADRDAGPLRGAANQRSHAIEVLTAVRGDAVTIAVRSPRRDGGLGAQPLADAIAAETAALLASVGDLDDVYPLTPTQQGMFFHAQKDPEALAYREQLVAVIAGSLDGEALAAAFQDVVARHELLRGEVHWRGLPEPHWVIRHSPNARVQTVPLPAHGGDEDGALRAFAAGEVARPFLFGSEPLVRTALVSLARDRHALVVTYHHVVLDGWSMPLLLGELVQCYRRRRGEALPPLAPPARFRDHVAFLRHQDATAQRAYWRQQLAGFDTPVELPGDRAPAAGAARRHDEVERWLDASDTAALQRFARTHGVTASTLVAAAWALALWRCSGRRDVLFGVTVAGRDASLADAERRIGLFINTLPLRFSVQPDTRVTTWLRAVQAVTAGALLHQHTPLPLAQAQTDVPAGVEPFESLLVFENYPLEQALRELPDGLSLERTFAFERTSYPLTVVAIPGERLCLRLLHDAARWSGAVAVQLLDGLLALLREFVRAPEATLGELAWLEVVRARTAELANGPAAARCEGVLVRWLHTAAATPDATAITGAGATTSHRQLAAMAGAAAARIAAHTRGDETIVALCCAPSGPGIAAMLGAWWSGAAYLPLDPAWPETRLHECIDAARPALVIADATTRARLPRDVPAIDVDDLVAKHGQAPPPRRDEPRRLAYAICTSGTTGRPKVVLIEHGALANYVGAAIDQFDLTPGDRVLQFASWAFDTAAEELWPTLCAGACLVLCPADARASSAALLALSARERVTVWDLPTAYFHALADALPHLGTPLPPPLRLCVLGGQACRAAAAHAFLQHTHGRVRLLETYGPSEATIVATWNELTPALVSGSAPPPIGRPVPGASAWVLGVDLGLLPIGMPGELCLAGRGLARGYLDDDAATRAHFVVHPATGERLYRTGDRARWRADGALEFLGRLDRQVKVAGVRVELDDVERALQRHPEVKDAVVIATAGDGGEPQLTAHVEMRHVEVRHVESTHRDAAALRAFVARSMPAAFVPAAVVVHERLPRTVTGKVDARALTAPPPSAHAATPRTAREAAVLAIFGELFPARAIHLHDDFFALGGSSLLAVRLLDAVHARCHVELPLRTLFATPTPAGIAAALDGGAGAAPDLSAETQLPADFPVPVQTPWRAPDRVLLTGATGFFGKAVLAALLARGAAVWCLVRAGDEHAARQRLRELAGADAAARAHVVCGDLTAPDLGLLPPVRDELARTVTTVVHAAAAVDFLRPYAHLRDTNVGGTLAVLRFCAESGALLHHVSSVGIFDDTRAGPTVTIDERDDARRFDRPVSGYAQSKWVAEQLVRAAGERGLAAVVHRPGRLIAADSATGGDTASFAAAAMRLCVALGKVPVLPGRFDLTPVHWAAQALVHLAHAPHAGATFHLVHPEPLTGTALMRLWQAAGWSGTTTSWPEFREAAIAWLQGNAGSISRSLLPFLTAATEPPAGEPVFACATTMRALGDDGPRCPPLGEAVVRGWLRALTV